MATTEYAVNHPSAVKLWSSKLNREALKRTWMYKFMGTGVNSVIQIQKEFSKGAGDRLTTHLRMQLTGAGVEGDGALEGNEESLTTYTDNFVINQLRHAVRSNGKMSEQRIPWSVREDAMDGLADWWAGRIDTALFNQLGGNTGQADTRYTGHNATAAPSSNNIVYPNALTTEAQVASASASNVFKVKFIDWAVEKAGTNSPLIRPIKINGEDKFVCFLHDYQVVDLRLDASTAGSWYDIQKAALQGGQISNNPIYTGALGEYNNTIMHKANRVVSVTSGVYRAQFCGAQAASVGFGQNYNGADGQKWVEKMFDYDNQLGVSAGMIWGAKKNQYNSQDFGSLVIPTYGAAHS